MGKKQADDDFVRWLHKRRYVVAKAVMLSSNLQTHEPVSGVELARLVEEFKRESSDSGTTTQEEKEKWSDALREAFEIGEGRRIRMMLDLIGIDSSITRFLLGVGLRDGDIAAMTEKTLLGQEIARILHRGILGGMEDAVEMLRKHDERASESLRKWMGDKDA